MDGMFREFDCRSREILQIQDRQLKKIPEAVLYSEKAGQAVRQPIPRPLSMFETVVALKPPINGARNDMGQADRGAERQHQDARHGETFSGCRSRRAPNVTTGFRSVLGVKVSAPISADQKLAVQVEKELADFPTAQRLCRATVGGYFLDFTVIAQAARGTVKSCE